MSELLLEPALGPNLPSLAVSPPHICCQFPDAGLETWPRCLDPPAWRHCVRKLLKFTTDQAWSQLVPLMRVDTRVTMWRWASWPLNLSLILCNSVTCVDVWATERRLDWERVWWAGSGYQEPGEPGESRDTQRDTHCWLVRQGQWRPLIGQMRTWKSVTDQTCLVTITNINSQFHQQSISI